MFHSRKVEQLEQENEDLHRLLAEKDKVIKEQSSLLRANQREYDSLLIAYNAMREQVLAMQKDSPHDTNDEVFSQALRHAQQDQDAQYQRLSRLTR